MPIDAASWFNAKLLKSFRDELNWTQEKLADRAGLSVRVVAKAEGGERVSRGTVGAMVKALRAAGKTIEIADLTINPETLARRFLKNYALHQANCVEHSLDILAPDIVAVIEGDPATNPIAGEYRGLKEFDALWKKFFAMFARAGGSLGDDPTIRCLGNEVIAWGYEFVHLPEIPPEAPGFVMIRMKFKEGKIVRLEDYYEASGMMHALQRFADQFPDAEWAKQLRATASQLPNAQGAPAAKRASNDFHSDSPPCSVDNER